MFHSYFQRTDDIVLTFNIVYFPPSNRRRTLKFQNLISAGGAC